MEPKSLENFQRSEVIVLTIDVVLALLLNDVPEPEPPPSGGWACLGRISSERVERRSRWLD
jgi:hypothetical protein